MNFEDFIKYLDILINGDQNEKNEWTFKLIDCKKRGFFDLPDFRALIELMCSAWILMTGNQTSFFLFYILNDIVNLKNVFF